VTKTRPARANARGLGAFTCPRSACSSSSGCVLPSREVRYKGVK